MAYTIKRNLLQDKSEYKRRKGLAKVDFDYVRKVPEKPVASQLPDDVVQAKEATIVAPKESASMPEVEEILATTGISKFKKLWSKK